MNHHLPKILARVVLALFVLLVGFAVYKCSRPTAKPQDQYGNSTIDTRKETKISLQRQDSARRAKEAHQLESNRLYNSTREKAPTPVTAASVAQADSNIRAIIRRRR